MVEGQRHKHEGSRSRRWIDGLRDLARCRGDGDAVWQRAVDLTRDLNIAPWIALAVAERLVPLSEAALLDRAARCEALQAAVLDQRKSVGELKTMLPYAPYFLAAEVVEMLGRKEWDLRKVTTVAKHLLEHERQIDDAGRARPVRRRTLAEYAAAVKHVRRLIEQVGCTMPMALEVASGRLSEAYVQQYVRQRRRLAHDERRAAEQRDCPPRTISARWSPAPGPGRSSPSRAPRAGARPSATRPRSRDLPYAGTAGG